MLSLYKNREVLNNVLEFVLETPNGRRSVSRIARTCKALSEPALNVLWKELDSIVPLLSLLPMSLFKRPRRPGLGFAKSPDSQDWRKLLAYGERVRRIAYNEAAGNVVASIFPVLDECKPQEFLLPNLESLVWKVETAEGLEHSLLFLTPQLRNLLVELGGLPQEDMIQFLSEISANTTLTTLSVTSSTKLPSQLPEILRTQRSLQKVVLMAPGALAPSIGRWLLSLEQLKSLKIEVGDRSDNVVAGFFNRARHPISSPSFSSDDESLPSSPRMNGSMVFVNMPASFKGFAELRDLHVAGTSSAISAFLGHVTSPLQGIELALDDPEKEKDWRNLWTTISQQFGRSLRSLQVSATGQTRFADLIRSTARGENAARRMPLDGLRDLLQLARLDIDVPESKVILDTDILHLATACPNLEIVKLCPLSRWPIPYGPPKLTLAGLAPLTAACRRLHTLHVPVNGVGTKDDSVFDAGTSSTSLLRLHVGHSWVGDALPVGILLSHLAPHLEAVKWFHERNRPGFIETHSNGWQRVTDILPALQNLVLRERSQAQMVTVVHSPAPSEPVFVAPPKVEKADQGVQTEVMKTAEFGAQARPQTRHKSVAANAPLRNALVDATPAVHDMEIDAVPISIDQEIDASPKFVSQAVETVALVPLSIAEDDLDLLDDGISRAQTNTYFGRTASFLVQAIRAISPPILMRLLDMWSMSALGPSKDYRGNMLALRSPLKISPLCQ